MQSYLASALSSSTASASSAQASSPIASFFRDRHFRLCLAYFDARRGEKEGHEYEKVLAFYPTSAALTIRTGIVGLAQALASFASSFAPTQPQEKNGTAKFMEAEQKKWTILECEPDIWLVLVVSKSWSGPGCSNESMQASLDSLHALFTLLHGQMTQLLEQDPTGFFVRRILQPFMDEAGNRLTAADLKDPAALINPLGMQRGIPLLPVPKQIFLGVQCLVNQLLIRATGGTRPVCGAMVCWKGHLLWGSLPFADCESLSLLACRSLGPATSLGINTSKGVAAFQDVVPLVSETLLSPHQWSAVPPSRVNAATQPPSSAPRSASTPQALSQLPGNYSSSASHDPDPSQGPDLLLGGSRKPKVAPGCGFLLPKLRQPSLPIDAGFQEQGKSQRHRQPAVQTAHVWLKALRKRCLLLPYFDGPLLVVVLLHEDVVPTHEVIASVAEVLTRECPTLTALLTRSLPKKNQWHHPGYRYCIKDHTLCSIRATPGSKVSTLSQQSLRLLAHTSNKLDYWSSASMKGLKQRKDSTPAHPGAPSSSNIPGQQDGSEAGPSEPVGPPPVKAPVQEITCALDQGAGTGEQVEDLGERGDCEAPMVVACRGFSDSSTWVVARKESGRRLLVAMETVPEPGLAGVMLHAQKLCDAAMPGMFL